MYNSRVDHNHPKITLKFRRSRRNGRSPDGRLDRGRPPAAPESGGHQFVRGHLGPVHSHDSSGVMSGPSGASYGKSALPPVNRCGLRHAIAVRQRWLRAPAANVYLRTRPGYPVIREWLLVQRLAMGLSAGVVVQRTSAKRMFAASEPPSASLASRDILFPALGIGRNGAECGPSRPFIRTRSGDRQAHFGRFPSLSAGFL